MATMDMAEQHHDNLGLEHEVKDCFYANAHSPFIDLSHQLRAIEIPSNCLSEMGELTSESIAEKLVRTTLNLSKLGLFEYRLTLDLSPDMLNMVTKLDLSGNSIEDFSAVKVSVFLEELDISFNNVKSLEPVKDLKFLQVLKAQHNHVSSVFPLKELKSLRFLNVRENKIHLFSQSYQVLKLIGGVNQLEIDRNPCFMKTKQAFDILAVGLALNVLNGVNLTHHYKQFDTVLLNRIRALNRSQIQHQLF